MARRSTVRKAAPRAKPPKRGKAKVIPISKGRKSNSRKGKRKSSHFPGPLGTGQRFRECVSEMESRPGVHDPEGLCATIGRRRYGKRWMVALARGGRRNPLAFPPHEDLVSYGDGRWFLARSEDTLGESYHVRHLNSDGTSSIRSSFGVITAAVRDLEKRVGKRVHIMGRYAAGRNPDSSSLQEIWVQSPSSSRKYLTYLHDPARVRSAKGILEEDGWETEVRESTAGTVARKGVKGSGSPTRSARELLRRFKSRIETQAKQNPYGEPTGFRSRPKHAYVVTEISLDGRFPTRHYHGTNKVEALKIAKRIHRQTGNYVEVFDDAAYQSVWKSHPEAPVPNPDSNPCAVPGHPDDVTVSHGAIEQHWREHEAMGIAGEGGGERENPSGQWKVWIRHHDGSETYLGPYSSKQEAEMEFETARMEVSGTGKRVKSAHIYPLTNERENPSWFSRVLGAESRSPSSAILAPIASDVLKRAYDQGWELGAESYRLNRNLTTDQVMHRGRRWFGDNYRAIPRGTSEREILNQYARAYRTAMLEAYRAEVETPAGKGKGSGKRRRNPRANPEDSAAALSHDFHGREPETVTTVRDEVRTHEWLAGLGALTEIEFRSESGRNVTLGFDPDSPDPTLLSSSEDGRQLYLVGGDQSVDLKSFGMDGRRWVRDVMVLGTLSKITYRTQKEFDGFETIDYFHKLGEETKVRPKLLYDTLNRELSIAGGQYRVERPGIIN